MFSLTLAGKKIRAVVSTICRKKRTSKVGVGGYKIIPKLTSKYREVTLAECLLVLLQPKITYN